MTRTKCNNCRRKFRSRVLHNLCRKCYRGEHSSSRPIISRELSENKYRRTRNRRGFIPKNIVPKVIANRNSNRGKNVSRP